MTTTTPAPPAPTVAAEAPPHNPMSAFGELPAHVPLDMPTESGPVGRRRRMEYWIDRFTQRIDALTSSLHAFPDDLLLKAERDALVSVRIDLERDLAALPTPTDWAFAGGLYIAAGDRNNDHTELRIDLALRGQDAVLQRLTRLFGGSIEDETWVLRGEQRVWEFLEGALAEVPATNEQTPIDHLLSSVDSVAEEEETSGAWNEPSDTWDEAEDALI